MIPRTGQLPDRPPAHTTLPAAGIRTMIGQEAPVSAAHARMLNHTLINISTLSYITLRGTK